MTLEIRMLLAFLIAAAVAALVTPFAIKLAPKIGAMDIPKDERRMHTKAMPRFGGLALFAGAVISILINAASDPRIYWVLGGALAIYVLGVVDDLKNLPAKLKFLIQTLVAVAMFFGGLRIQFISNIFGQGRSELGTVICFIVTVLWIVGITNTVNLIDGMDGLAAGTSAIASLSIAYVAYTHGMTVVAVAMVAVAGAAVGFLPFNFYPAKIFMGDGGALFLGFMLATVSIIGPIKSATLVAVIVPVLVLGVPIFDTAFAILRRIANKRPIMEADKGHLHHRLARLGYGQRRATLMLYCISGIMGVAAITLSRGLYVETIGLFLIAMVLIYILITDPNHIHPTLKNEEPKKDDQNK